MRTAPEALTEKLRLSLDPASYVPFYEQIAKQIRDRIQQKILAPGAEFYSEGELAKLLGISKMPVRQAFQKLRADGLLVIARGKRPVIGSGRVRWDFQQLHGFSEEMRLRGFSPSARILSFERQHATPEISEILRLSRDNEVFYLKRLRLVDNQPVAVVTSFLPVHIFPGLEKIDLGRQSLYNVIENTYQRRLQSANEIIGAIVAGPEDAHTLQTPVGSPLLIIRETTFDTKETPIEYSISLLRGDRYAASVVSVRNYGDNK